MKDALELNIKGIKCDNPKCDYRNDKIKVEEYDEWLNKPCPKCGAILLTQEDLDNVKLMTNMVNTLNGVLPKRKKDEPIVGANIKMNGTGNMEIKIDK